MILDALRMAGLRRAGRTVPLVTGANGFVGSHLVALLLRRGFSVKALCRSRDGATAAERVRLALRWHGIDSFGGLEVIDGDVCKPNFGLSDFEFTALAKSTTEIIHCASSTSFAEKNRRVIEETNIQGLRHCLALVRQGYTSHFHQISTAYAAGMTDRPCPEDLIQAERFHNPYESSKNLAESLVAHECGSLEIGWTIYRPSVIAGDTRTGRTLLFNAMYFPVRFFDHMQSVVRSDFGTEQGENARQMNTRLGTDGTVHLPLRVSHGTRAGGLINIVPIDFVVDAFEAIYLSDDCHGVFNLVNERPARLADLLAHIGHYYKIRGIEAVPESDFATAPPSNLDSSFKAFASIYAPYMEDTRTFRCERVQELLPFGKRSPEIDYAYFARCIDYAKQCRWRSPLRLLREPDVSATSTALTSENRRPSP